MPRAEFKINTRKSPANSPKEFDRLCSALGLESMSQVARVTGLDATLISKFRSKKGNFGKFPSMLIELIALCVNRGVHPDDIKTALRTYRPKEGDAGLVIALAALLHPQTGEE